MDNQANIRSAAVGALAPLFGDAWIPPFMRDVAKVSEAAAACPTFSGVDPARAEGALRAASRLHPELRVPGALFFMGKLGAYFLDAVSGSWTDGYVQAPAAMAWPTWFCADLPEHPFALAHILDDFAWRAAAALLPPRAAAHEASLGAHSVLPGLSPAQAVDDGWFDAAAFVERSMTAFDIFQKGPLGLMERCKTDEKSTKEVRKSIGDWVVKTLAAQYGEENAVWIAKTAEAGFADGFHEALAKKVAAGEADPWSPTSVMRSFASYATERAEAKCRTADGSYAKRDVLFELGPARSSRMFFAAKASIPSGAKSENGGASPWWLNPGASPDRAKPREAPGYPDVYFGKRTEDLRHGTGDGIAAVLREHSVPGVFRARTSRPGFLDFFDEKESFWRFAGVWRHAAKALDWEWDSKREGDDGDQEGFNRETVIFGAACASVVRADFLAEWYGKCAALPGRLFVASLAMTLAEWAKDGRLLGAAAGAAKDFFGGGRENLAGRLRLEGGTRRGRLGKESVMGYAFTAKSAAAQTAVRISALIGSGSAREEDSEAKTDDYAFDLDWMARWDPELDAGIAELAEAAGSQPKRAALAAEAMSQRGGAFPDFRPAARGVKGALWEALSRCGFKDVREEELRAVSKEAEERLGADAAGFAEMLRSSPADIRKISAGAPAGRHAGVWAVGTMIGDATTAKARRAANTAAALGVEGRKLAMAAKDAQNRQARG